MDARPGGSPTPEPASGIPGGLDVVETELARLGGLDIAAHVDVFAAIHRQLTEALAVTGSQGHLQGQPAGPGHQAPAGAPHPSQTQPDQPQGNRPQRGR